MVMTVMTRQYVVYDFQFFMGFSTVYRLGFCIIPHKQLDSLARILVRCKMFVQARCLQARCLWRKKQYFQYRKSHMMNFKLSINRTLKMSPDVSNLRSCIIAIYSKTFCGCGHGGRTIILDHFSLYLGPFHHWLPSFTNNQHFELLID